MKKWLSLIGIALCAVSCEEAPVYQSTGTERLNHPVGMAIVGSYGIVVNSNITLGQNSGGLIAIDLSSDQLLLETLIPIPSFGGHFVVDSGMQRIYIPDKENDALLVYKYDIPGSGGLPISFSKVSVPSPIEPGISNGIEVDENPSSAVLVSDSLLGEVVMVANQLTGSVSVISTNTLTATDLDAHADYNGRRLLTALNFTQEKKFPGQGAYRLVQEPSTKLVYVTSTSSNVVYVVDPSDLGIEAAIDFSSLAGSLRGTRGLAFDGLGKGYIIHKGLKSMIVFDSSSIVNNGANYELVTPSIISVVGLGQDPEDIVIDSGLIFVSHLGEESVYVYSLSTLALQAKVFLQEGADPLQVIVDSGNGRFYTSNFFSNSFSVFDLGSYLFVKDIE
ncbi:MAG: hypothetical protein KDD52_06855 [Bdellovibrionales bacterium]|nr:hypothetical protein [Bdellovibrionales bacterium]